MEMFLNACMPNESGKVIGLSEINVQGGCAQPQTLAHAVQRLRQRTCLWFKREVGPQVKGVLGQWRIGPRTGQDFADAAGHVAVAAQIDE